MPEYPSKFLKMILTDDTKSIGLVLPEKFSRKHEKDLFGRVTLMVPNDDVWQVNVIKSKGHVWLKRGWGEFVECYSIKFGHLLQFFYEGSSRFRVIIFSADASEIVYPQKKDDNAIRKVKSVDATKAQVSCHGLKTVKSEDETSGDETSGDETSEDENPVIKINDGGECSINRGRKQRMEDGTRIVKDGGELPEWPEKIRRNQRMHNGKKELVKLKNKFKCSKPFFMVCITQSYVGRKRGVCMSVKFRKKLVKYLRRSNFDDNCLLQLENDETKRTWEVVAGARYLGDADWLMFVKDNGITFGDICVFTLLHKRENVISVRIIRRDS